MAVTHEVGPLEMQVLGLLGPEPLAVSEIRKRLESAGTELAYTTVMTVLVRLQAKGLAERSKQGNRYLYCAARKTPRFSADLLNRVGKALFDRDRARPILALLDDGELTHEELRRLRKAIDQKLRSKP